MAALKETEDEAVTRFREYLRIPSVHPNVNYDECVSFLTRQASSLGLPIQVHQLVKNKPIVVITWEGTNPTLPTILLNSHMDVVPVYREKWTKDPFNAEKDEHGNIYGRGSQDMKCVGIQYLEAIRKLKKEGVKLRRTVHISFMPDEEIGGKDGMRKFVNTSDFFELNIGVALDESVASPMEELLMFYAERSSWNVEVHCSGTPGHGTLFHEDTSGEKLQIILDRFMTYRQQQKDILETKPHPIFSLAEVTSLNLTQMKSTLVPPDLVLVFDVRVAIDQDHQELEELMQSWCLEAGPGVTLTFAQKDPNFGITELDHNNPWWAAFKGACNEMEVNLRPMICPGVTDARYIRQLDLPAFGFSPINHTPILLHDHDEFLNEKIFLRGIEIYTRIIPALANLTGIEKYFFNLNFLNYNAYLIVHCKLQLTLENNTSIVLCSTKFEFWLPQNKATINYFNINIDIFEKAFEVSGAPRSLFWDSRS